MSILHVSFLSNFKSYISFMTLMSTVHTKITYRIRSYKKSQIISVSANASLIQQHFFA